MGSVGRGRGRCPQINSVESSGCARRWRPALRLKIRVSVVRFRPWPPSISIAYHALQLLADFCAGFWGTPLARTDAPEHNQLGTLVQTAVAHPVRRLDQIRELPARVMCRDPLGTMAQQILPVLEAHACRP